MTSHPALRENELRRSSGSLHFSVSGRGQPLIALHGFGATSYAWRHVGPELAERYEVFLVDLKGHGASPRPRHSGYSLEDQADLVHELILERNLADVILLGNSLGGGVALTLALKLAEEGRQRISALILLDSVYKAPIPAAFRILKMPTLGRLAMSLPARMTVALTLWYVTASRRAISPDAVEEYASNLTIEGGREALLECIRQIDTDHADDVVGKVRKLDVPSLIVWGEKDPLFSVEIGRNLSADLRTSHYHVIRQCGHLPQEEQPRAVLAHIHEFLGSLGV